MCFVGGATEGKAMKSFSVNKNPSLGDCNVRNAVGTEMETEFNIFCYEWGDQVFILIGEFFV